MKKTLVMAVAIIFSISASAQLISSTSVTKTKAQSSSYNRLGISYNSISGGSDFYISSMNGVSLGWTTGIPISKSIPLFIETGIGATYAESESYYGYYDKFTATMFALTVPVNITYKFDIGGTDFAIAPYAGLYLRGILSGTWKYEFGNDYYDDDDDYDDGSWYDDDFDGAFTRFQVGFDIGVNFEYKKFYLGLGYATDISALYDKNHYTARLGTFNATLGFMF